MANMLQILKETEQVLSRKIASANGKQALAGESPESMPGSEHDGKPPEGSTKADSQVAEGGMGPASARKVEGAGDDSPVTRGHALDATESAKEPAKKPLITSDAEAKAAAMANDILKDVLTWKAAQKTAAAEIPPAKKEEGKTEPAKKEDGKPAAEPKKPEAPPAGQVANTAPATEQKAGSTLELTNDVLAKIAAIALSYDEGAEFVGKMLEKYAGEKAAQETMSFLEAQNREAEKKAAMEQGYRDAQALINQQIFAAGMQAAKQAVAGKLTPEQLRKLGQEIAQGSMQDAMGAMAGGAPAGGAPAGGMPPAAEAGAGAGEPPAGGGQEYTIDDVAAALDMMVKNQEIKPEEAQEILQSIAGGGEAGGAAPGAAPAGEPPAGAAPGGDEKPSEKPAEKKDEGEKKDDGEKKDAASKK